MAINESIYRLRFEADTGPLIAQMKAAQAQLDALQAKSGATSAARLPSPAELSKSLPAKIDLTNAAQNTQIVGQVSKFVGQTREALQRGMLEGLGTGAVTPQILTQLRGNGPTTQLKKQTDDLIRSTAAAITPDPAHQRQIYADVQKSLRRDSRPLQDVLSSKNALGLTGQEVLNRFPQPPQARRTPSEEIKKTKDVGQISSVNADDQASAIIDGKKNAVAVEARLLGKRLKEYLDAVQKEIKAARQYLEREKVILKEGKLLNAVADKNAAINTSRLVDKNGRVLDANEIQTTNRRVSGSSRAIAQGQADSQLDGEELQRVAAGKAQTARKNAAIKAINERSIDEQAAQEQRNLERRRAVVERGNVLRRQAGLAEQVLPGTPTAARTAQPNPFGDKLRKPFGEFFGKGFETTLKYALPSAVLYGGFSQIKEALKDAGELQHEFALLQAQINDTFGDGADAAFASMHDNIFQVAKDLGIATAEVAKTNRLIQATFKDSTLTDSQGNKKSGEALQESQSLAAGQLSKISGFSTEEITNKLTAAAITYGVTYDRIGDIVTKMESVSGVKSKDNIDFIAALGPAAEDAHIPLERLAALSSSILQRTSDSGAVAGEKLGRAIPAITNDPSKLLGVIAQNPLLSGNKKLIDAVGARDIFTAFSEIGSVFGDLNDETKQFFINLFGGSRQAVTILAAFADQAQQDQFSEDGAIQNSVGTLQKRMDALKNTFGQIADEAKQSLTQLVALIATSGIGEAFGLAFKSVKSFLSVLNTVVGAFLKVDDSIGKVGTRLAGILLVMRAIGAVTNYTAGRKITGAATNAALTAEQAVVQRGVIARQTAAVSAGAAARGSVGLTGLPGVYRAASASARAGFVGRPSIAPGDAGVPSVAALGRLGSAGAGLRAAGSGLYTALGGAAGVATFGALALTAAYSYMGKLATDAKAAVEEAAQKAAAAGDTNDQLLEAAKKSEQDVGLWATVYSGGDTSGFGEAYRVEVRKREIAKTADITNALVKDKQLSKDFGQQLVNKYKPAKSSSYDSVVALETRNDSNAYENDDLIRRITGNPNANAKDTNDTQRKQLNQVRAILQESKPENVFNDLTKIQETNEYARGLIQQAQNDPGNKTALDKIQASLKKVEVLQGKDYQTAGDQYSQGIISYREYQKAADDYLSVLARSLESGDTEGIGNDQIRANQAKAIKDKSDRAAKRYDDLSSINQAILPKNSTDSAKADLELQTAKFNDVDIKDDKAKRAEIAIAIIKANKAVNDSLAGKATSLEDYNNLVSQNTINPAVRQSILQAQLDSSPTLNDLATKDEAFGAKIGSTISVGGNPEVQNLRKSISISSLVQSANEYRFKKINNQELLPSDQGTRTLIEKRIKESKDGHDDALAAAYQQILDFMVGNTNELFGAIDALGQATAEDNQKAISALNTRADSIANNLQAKNPDNNDFKLNSNLKLAQDKLTNARALKGPDPEVIANGINDAETAVINAQKEIRDKQRRTRELGIQLSVAGNSDPGAQARAAMTLALNKLRDAKDSKDTNLILEAQIGVAEADQKSREAANQLADLAAQLISAKSRDPEVQARAALAAARAKRRRAKNPYEAAQADIDVQGAQFRVEDAALEVTKAQGSLYKTFFGEGNSLITAQFDVFLADQDVAASKGKGMAAEYAAIQARISAGRNLDAVMDQIRQSRFNLVEAELKAYGDNIGAAQQGIRTLQDQLATAERTGKDESVINGIKAQLATGKASLRDETLRDKIDNEQYLYDIGRQTRQQFITYLRALQQGLNPASKQFKDLERQIYGLSKSAGDSLQFNIPGNLKLPTLYEARRLNQSVNPGGGQAGYQDNRQQSVVVYVTNDMSASQVVRVMQDALGGQVSGTQPRLY